MTRRELATRIGKLTGLTAAQAARVLEVLPDVVATELAEHGQMHWRGLGTFTVRTYPARKIHNPATGRTIALAARKSVGFKPAHRLRTLLGPRHRRRGRTVVA
ncbi:MAG: HU family DNA-binding protein [Thermodesulfobacteriota bacterium]